MQPRSAPSVRPSSTAVYPHHTVPSTAAHIPTTPVHRHLELPRCNHTVRFPSTAAYPHRTDPSTAAFTPKTPVRRLLELHVPPVSAPPRLPRRLRDARHTVPLTTPLSYPPTHTSSPRRRSRGLQAVPATPCNTPWGRRNVVTPGAAPTPQIYTMPALHVRGQHPISFEASTCPRIIYLEGLQGGTPAATRREWRNP